MPRRPTRSVPTVIIPGLDGSGPDHWQTWLAGELRAADRQVAIPDLPSLDAPQLPEWLAALGSTLASLETDRFDVVAHSLGGMLWLHHASHTLDVETLPRPARVALVSIPAPDISVPQCEGFFPPPIDIAAVRAAANGTVLVGSDNDPFCPGGIARVYGAPLKIATTVIPGAAHLNVESGHGPWPAMLDWCQRDNLAFIA
jgi:uncharacterized protein